MRNSVLYILILITFVSCFNPKSKMDNSENDSIFILKKLDPSRFIDSITGDTIPFMISFYLDYNIILIDTLPEIYFHKQRFFCLTGRNGNNLLPFFRCLKPEYFEKSNNPIDLIDSISKNINDRRRVYLISNKDTVTDKKYFKIKKLLIENGIEISPRLLTEEESEILKSILNGVEYQPEKIEWKNTLYVPTDFNFYLNPDTTIIEYDTITEYIPKN